ncbi:MAG: prefoldin subunit beta [Candidatus Pacearchaeota archaeon]|nr:prefoldin subunit beta [Candidatus Pacearchaeota archaeon]
MNMKPTQEIREKLQEFQILEQNLQNIFLQKQAFQIELNETESALKEISSSSEEVYKIVGNIMVRAKKPELVKELEEKKEILNLRLKSLNNQEKILSEKMEKSRQELEKELKSEEKNSK